MKDLQSKLISTILMGLLLITTISCKMNFIEDKIEGTYITVNVNQSERAIVPSLGEKSLSDIVLYKGEVSAENVLGKWADYRSIGGNRIILDSTGECTFILTAKLGTLSLLDSKTINVTEGANFLNFSFTASKEAISSENGNGSVMVDFEYSDFADPTATLFVLEPLPAGEKIHGNFVESHKEDNKTKLTFEAKTVPAGVYKMSVQARLADKKYANASEIVYVSKDMVSYGKVSCTEFTDWGLLPSVKITFMNGNTLFKEIECFPTDDINDYLKRDYPQSSDTTKMFHYWETSEGKSIGTVPEEDITLYAHFDTAYTVSFETFGGSSVPSILIPEGAYLHIGNYGSYCTIDGSNEKDNNRDVPEKDHAVFDEWCLDEELTKPFSEKDWKWDNGFTITGNVTLYAKYISAYKVTVMDGEKEIAHMNVPQKGSVSIANENTLYLLVRDMNNKFIQRKDFSLPEKEDSVFMGWRCEYNGTEEETSLLYITNINSDVVIYVNWAAPVVLTFKTEIGGETYTEVSLPAGIRISNYYGDNLCYGEYGSNKVTVKRPLKENLIFAGWYLDEDFKTSLNNQTITENTTVYAKWAEACTINFNSMGGSAVESLTVPKGEFYINNYSVSCETEFFSYQNSYSVNIPFPEKEGKLFGGWCLYDDCTNIVDNLKIDSNVTLYAKWVSAFTISFETYSGSTIDSITLEDGKSFSLRQESANSYELYVYNSYGNYDYSVNVRIPEKPGCTFGGFYLDDKFVSEVPSYYGQRHIVDSNVTIYVKWLQPSTVEIMDGSTKITELELILGETYYLIRGYTGPEWAIIDPRSGNSFGTIPETDPSLVIEGLYKDEACTQKIGPSYTLETTTLYVKKITPVKVTFRCNANTYDSIVIPNLEYVFSYGRMSENTEELTISIVDKETSSNGAIVGTLPVISGKTFNGWYEDASYTKLVNPESFTPTTDITLYAKYDDTVVISYVIPDDLSEIVHIYTGKSVNIANGSKFYIYKINEESSYPATTTVVWTAYNNYVSPEYVLEWYLDNEYTKPVPTTPENAVEILQDTKIYAKCTKK